MMTETMTTNRTDEYVEKATKLARQYAEKWQVDTDELQLTVAEYLPFCLPNNNFQVTPDQEKN